MLYPAELPGQTPESGGAEEDRTPDLCIANAALSQLSYGPTRIANIAQAKAADLSVITRAFHSSYT